MSFVVAGGTGTVGSKITRELLGQGHQVRVLTRDAERAAERLGHQDGLEFFQIDLTDPGRLVGGFGKGDRVFVGLGGSPTQVQDENALIDAAASAEVEYLVKLSCEGVDTGTENLILDVHRAVEGHLADSGIPSTLVRPSTFIDTIVSIASQFIPQDAWGGNSADGVCTFVDTRDVAEVFASLLRQGPEAHAGRAYTLTGPDAVSMSQVAELISTAVSREVRHHERAESENESFLTGLGLPPLQVAVLLGLDQFTREGIMSQVHGDTHVLLGKPARPAAAFINETVAELLSAS
ncbi:NmrA family NAD(P)-binding protein [Streptomyces sp. NPDC002018]|uniref:NmrA family NAD(P)-binding protein n=1 Tax=Streptomyces sp. NPDC002018 TaxID=3364629 RepID=UPI003677B07F